MVEDRELTRLRKELQKKKAEAELKREKARLRSEIKDLTPSRGRELRKSFIKGAKITGRGIGRGFKTTFKIAAAAGRNIERAKKTPVRLRTLKAPKAPRTKKVGFNPLDLGGLVP
jgi:hypothetical protein